MPYGGNFIYRDLNGDNKLDARDYARLPAHKIYAKRKTHTSAIIMIGLKTMSEYQPFANEQAAQDALNDLYTAVHKWHQELAVVDAILSQKASCQYLRYYCQLAQYDLSGYTWATSKTWDAGLLLIQKANRLMKFGPVNPPDSSFYGHVLGIRGYVKMELTDMFGSFPDYNTLQPYKTVYMASAGSVRSKIKEDLNAAFRLLPNLSKAVTDRSRLSKEAINALLVRNALNDKNYAEAAAIAMPIFDDDSAVVLDPTRYSYYTNSASREIIWGYEIASSDLQEIFRKGRYIPVIQLNQLITTHAEAYAQVGKKDEAIALINLIASRSGFTPYPRPWTQSLSETMAKIQLQVFTDQKIEGTSFKSMVRWDMAMTALGPLGFKAHQVLMPIPLSFLNDYPKIMQNPGYQ